MGVEKIPSRAQWHIRNMWNISMMNFFKTCGLGKRGTIPPNQLLLSGIRRDELETQLESQSYTEKQKRDARKLLFKKETEYHVQVPL